MSTSKTRLLISVALLTVLLPLGYVSFNAFTSYHQKAIAHERMRKAADPESTPIELTDLFATITLEIQGMTNRLSAPNARADNQLYSTLRYDQVTMMLLAMNSSLPPETLVELEQQFQQLRENSCYVADVIIIQPDGDIIGTSTNDFNKLFGPKAVFNNHSSSSYEETYVAWEVLTRMQNGDEMWGNNPFLSKDDILKTLGEEGFQVTGDFDNLWGFSFAPFRYLTPEMILYMWNAPNLSTNQLRTIRVNIASTKPLERKIFERIIRNDDDPVYPADRSVRLALSQNRNLPPDLALELLVNDYFSFEHGALVEPDLAKVFKGFNVDVFKGTDLDPQTGQTNYWAKGPNGQVYLRELPSYWDIFTKTLQVVPKSDFPADVIPNLNNLIKAGLVHVASSNTNMVYVVPGPQRKEWAEEFSRVAGNSNAAHAIGFMFSGSLVAYRQDIIEVLQSLQRPKCPRGSFFTTPFGKFIGHSLDEGLKHNPAGIHIGPHDKALELFREHEHLLLSLPGSFLFPPRTGDLYEDIQAVVEKARTGVPQGKPVTTLPPASLRDVEEVRTLHNNNEYVVTSVPLLPKRLHVPFLHFV